MSHIFQCRCATNIGLNADITDPNNIRMTCVAYLHSAKVPCFVRREQLITKSSMIGCRCVNNPLNLIICNTQTFFIFTSHFHYFSIQCSYSVSVILLLIVGFFLFFQDKAILLDVALLTTVKAFSRLFPGL